MIFFLNTYYVLRSIWRGRDETKSNQIRSTVGLLILRSSITPFAEDRVGCPRVSIVGAVKASTTVL